MSLIEQIYTQALVLAGVLDERQQALLKVLCQGAITSLAARLRVGLTPEDCKADFIAAASLFALAAISECGDADAMEQITAGDVTLRRVGTDVAANCLRYQAELMIAPYLKNRFSFKGV